MRKKIVAGNWKMNMDYTSGLALVSEISNMVKDEVSGDQQVVICTPYIHLSSVAQLLKSDTKVFLGAENCHHEKSGAYTGEISAAQLKSVGTEYVILGHSERRQYFGEDEALLAKKADVALENSLIPIFCIGETKEERESNEYESVILKQLKGGVFHLSAEEFSKVILAYEPVWAIGTGLTATPEQAQEVHKFIRNKIAENYNQDVADDTTILYGGSCNPQNAKSLFSQPDIDGGLIGGASLKSRDFTDIIKSF